MEIQNKKFIVDEIRYLENEEFISDCGLYVIYVDGCIVKSINDFLPATHNQPSECDIIIDIDIYEYVVFDYISGDEIKIKEDLTDKIKKACIIA